MSVCCFNYRQFTSLTDILTALSPTINQRRRSQLSPQQPDQCNAATVRSLSLHGNQLTSLEPSPLLSVFQALTHLDLSSNQLQSVDGLRLLGRTLRYLDLTNNQVQYL
jgi:Leucine-rich repeat (LRR) protein